LIVGHKDVPHFLKRVSYPTMAACDGRNEVPPVILPHECVEKLGPSITILEKVAFYFLAEKLVLRKL
jgi:hypothetical protein